MLCKSHNNEIKQSSKLDIPKDQFNQKSWTHFGTGNFSSKAENLLKLTLKLLNIFVHIIQDASPSVIQQRTGIIPPSPIRKKPGFYLIFTAHILSEIKYILFLCFHNIQLMNLKREVPHRIIMIYQMRNLPRRKELHTIPLLAMSFQWVILLTMLFS